MKAEVLSHQRFDIYRIVTDSIIAAIEAGAGEFVMPWHGFGAPIAKPQNARSRCRPVADKRCIAVTERALRFANTTSLPRW